MILHRPSGCPSLHARHIVSLVTAMVSFVLVWVIFAPASALAVEQCRFIQAKPEREACYARQQVELAAKRKPEPSRDKTMDSLEQMKHEDEALNRQLHSICRGC